MLQWIHRRDYLFKDEILHLIDAKDSKVASDAYKSKTLAGQTETIGCEIFTDLIFSHRFI